MHQLNESLKCPVGQEENAAIAMAPKGEATHERRLRAALDCGILARDTKISIDGYLADSFTSIVRGHAEWTPGSWEDGSYKLTLEHTREDDFGDAEMKALLMDTIKATIDSGATIDAAFGGSGRDNLTFVTLPQRRARANNDD